MSKDKDGDWSEKNGPPPNEKLKSFVINSMESLLYSKNSSLPSSSKIRVGHRAKDIAEGKTFGRADATASKTRREGVRERR